VVVSFSSPSLTLTDTYFVATRTSFSAASDEASGRNAQYPFFLWRFHCSRCCHESRDSRSPQRKAPFCFLRVEKRHFVMQSVDIVEFSARRGLAPRSFDLCTDGCHSLALYVAYGIPAWPVLLLSSSTCDFFVAHSLGLQYIYIYIYAYLNGTLAESGQM
jgi:hypothetical protein